MRITICCFLLLLATFSHGQERADTLLLQTLDSVLVTAPRLETEAGSLPYAFSHLGKSKLQAAQQQTALNEGLARIPGLFATNPDNFAQDARLSIRGFGARSAFGIRGIKILVDGLPESTPDGQAQVDNIDPGILNDIEVIRGPASGLYGNAAGGVISMSTEPPPAEPFGEARITGGSFGLERLQIKAAGRKDKLGAVLYGSHTQMDGYREHSRSESTLFNGKFNYDYNFNGRLQLLVNYLNSPLAQDPGSLTREQVQADRRQAFPRNVEFDAGESVEQSRAGLRWQHALSNKQQLEARAFYLWRDFDNLLPFEEGGAVNLKRDFLGGGASYRYRGKLLALPYQFRLGVDVEQQTDQRRRNDNLQGERGPLSLDQEEAFRNIGLYWVQELELSPAFSARLSTRYDDIRIEAEDQFLSDGDDSGAITYQRFNPSFGLLYTFSPPAKLFANLSTSFETPALSELSANPSTGGGFNTGLSPQQATNYELGFRGQLNGQLEYQLAAFYIFLQDELLPFELEGFPGRSFFRNAGESERQGLELSLNWAPTTRLYAELSYTYSNFSYLEYNTSEGDFAGNQLPGVPPHFGFFNLRYTHPSGFLASLRGRYVGSLYVNDANTEKDDAFLDAGLRLSHSVEWKNWNFHPFLGVNNLLDAEFHNNIRINAFGGRYYEPAPGIHFYAGLRARFGE